MREFHIRNILVPTDFSSIARYGVHHAEAIARRTGARITLLHVVEPIGNAFGTSGMLGIASRIEQTQRATGLERAQRLARAAAKRSHVQVDPLVRVGRVARVITRVASHTRADLIIMGTHGASGFMEHLLGSNTYRIASLARTPLLSVHRRIGATGYHHMIYPVRDETRAMKKFSEALLFAKFFKADVHIVGLRRPDQHLYEKRMRAACNAVRQEFIKRRVGATVAFTSHDYFPEAIVRYAQDRPGSLVVIVQDSDFHLVEVFQGTFTKAMLHKALSPVLMIPN